MFEAKPINETGQGCMFTDGNAMDPLSVIIRMANATALLPWLAFDPVS